MYKKDEEENKSLPEETVNERVNLRGQKADHEYLSAMPPLEGDEKELKKGKD